MSAADRHDCSSPRVRILLDVDGVLNAVTRTPYEHWDDWQSVECMGFTIRYSRCCGSRLLALAQRPGVEVRWLTTWEHNANTWIGPLFEFPQFTVVDRHDITSQPSGLLVATSGWWKFDEARALWDQDGVPFVWVDDDLGFNDDGASDWIKGLEGQALGISPHSEKGLTPRLLDEIERFVAEHIDGPPQ